MKKAKHFIEYLLLRALETLVSAPPLGMALRFGESLGLLVKQLLGKRDVLIVSNLSKAYPDKSIAEIRLIADNVWRNIGRVSVEFIRSRELLSEEKVPVEGRTLIADALKEGKGAVLLSAHYCNWEFAGIFIQRFIHEFVAVYRPMKNPFVDEWIRQKRSMGGIPVILHRQAVKASFKLMRQNGVIGILADQNLYHGGIFVDFFGRPAATTTLPALLHVRTGAPVILTHIGRENGTFRMYFERLSFPDVAEDQRITSITQTINDAMERVIRERPEWWFWIHNRWKRSAEAALPPEMRR